MSKGTSNLAPTEGPLSDEATNLLHGILRTASENPIGWPGQTKIGSVSERAATQQLESNVAVLKSATGEAITQSATEVIPVGVEPATFGLQVDLRVHSLSELSGHIGDVFLGLATGLVGTPEAAVEGLAINVVDDSGARASLWMNGRLGDGSALGTSETLNPSDAHHRCHLPCPRGRTGQSGIGERHRTGNQERHPRDATQDRAGYGTIEP